MRVYISRQRAASFGSFSYYKAKRGQMMLVRHAGETWWLGYVIPHGFYLVAFDHKRGQSEQLKAM
jgi:hypothetical protein